MDPSTYINDFHSYIRHGQIKRTGFPNNHQNPKPSLFENPQNPLYDNSPYHRYYYTEGYERSGPRHPIRLRIDNFIRMYRIGIVSDYLNRCLFLNLEELYFVVLVLGNRHFPCGL